MAASYTFLGNVITNAELEKLVVGIGVCLALVGVGFLCTKKIRTAQGIKENLVPSKKFSITSLFDFFVEAFVNYYDSILGKHNREHVGFCASIFFFLVFSNLVGLIPGFATPTTTIWINVGLALVVFFYFNFIGIREHGLWGYIKHFAGPAILLAPLIFPLEIISTVMRILTLNLRLYWNINADHIILGVATDLIKGLGFIVYPLGVFVSLVQAFVFTTLTMIYILLASQHGEEDH